jgi:DNA-binding GntR family transcriptional regulator
VPCRQPGVRMTGRASWRPYRKFHEQILTSVGSVRLTRAVNGARDAIFSRGLSTEAPDRTWHDLVVEHEAVLDAIRG